MVPSNALLEPLALLAPQTHVGKQFSRRAIKKGKSSSHSPPRRARRATRLSITLLEKSLWANGLWSKKSKKGKKGSDSFWRD